MAASGIEPILIILGLHAFCLLGLGSCQSMTVFPNPFNTGVDKTLTIVCKTDGIEFESRKVVAIQITKDGNTIATIPVINNGGRPEVKTTGFIYDSGADQSYLEAVINHPKVTDAGEYLCNVNYTAGEPDLLSAQTRINATAVREISHWRIEVFTKGDDDADTNGKVDIQIFGDQGKSDRFELDNDDDNFEKDQIDKFDHKMADIGTPSELSVWHEKVFSSEQSWHLDRIELIRTSGQGKGDRYIFDCNCWMMSNDTLTLKPVTHWKATVKTSTNWAADTDKRVTISVFGDNGNTKTVLLTSEDTKLEQGHSDVFQFQTANIGTPDKIRVTAGGNDMWGLETIVLENLERKENYTFKGDWIAHLQGSKPETREFQVSKPDVNWIATVKTSATENSETDKKVTISLIGLEGESRTIQLDNEDDNFERGQTDVFGFQTVDVGDLTTIRVTGGEGSDPWRLDSDPWRLDSIVLENTDTGESFTFRCECWFTTGFDSDPETKEIKLGYPDIKWKVTVTTDIFRNSQTNDNVTISLVGSEGHSRAIQLDNEDNNFENGQTDVFRFQTSGIGSLALVRITAGGSDDWRLDTMVLENTDTGEAYTIRCGCWFLYGDGRQPETRDIKVGTPDIKWKATVKTGTAWNSNTQNNVTISIYGHHGHSRTLLLANGETNFERGQTDVFVFDTVDVGNPTMVRVTAGGSDAWRLDTIVLENMNGAETFTFECNCWFFNSGEHSDQDTKNIKLSNP